MGIEALGDALHAGFGFGQQALDFFGGRAGTQRDAHLDGAGLPVGGEGDGLSQPDVLAVLVCLPHMLPHFRAARCPLCLPCRGAIIPIIICYAICHACSL